MTCWPSRTVMPIVGEGRQHRRLARCRRRSACRPRPRRLRMSRISRAAAAEQAGIRRDRAAQPDHPGVDVLRAHPRAVEPVVLGRRPEIPDVRVAATGEQRVAGHLVARPLPDVGARDVADVVEVEQQERPDLRCLERRAGPCRPVRPQPIDVPALFPVDVHRAGRRDRWHDDGSPLQIDPRRRDRVGAVRSSMLHTDGEGASPARHGCLRGHRGLVRRVYRRKVAVLLDTRFTVSTHSGAGPAPVQSAC